MAKERPANFLDIMDGDEVDANSRERIVIYARAGMGKTRFALSYPEGWGKAAYYAADDNSWLLHPVSRELRSRVKVIRPSGSDPMSLFQQFCMINWDEVDPEIGVLIVDTYTKVAMDCLSHSANTMTLDREKHYVVGDIGKGGIAIPNRGDYQGLDGLSKQFMTDLFKNNPNKHIIFILHEESRQLTEGAPFVGGPQHPGRQMIDYLPGQFSTVIRLIREDVLNEDGTDVSPVVIAITENDGKFVAKLRTDDVTEPNPLARRVLQRDPRHWWADFEKYQNERRGGTAPAATPKKKRK